MKEKFKKIYKKIATACAASALAVMTVVTASAQDLNAGSEAVSAVQSALSGVTDVISISNVLQIIGIGLGASVGFFLMWFGIRWVIRKVTKAFKSGRLGA